MSDSVLMEENRRKLELETHSLGILKEMSHKCSQSTKSIETILSKFDDRLATLERSIQPVYKETGNLQSKQHDLVKTLEKLDHVIQFYSVTSEVEETINAGPANQLELYMQCLKKLESAIEYFSQYNPGSPEYMNVSQLFKNGCDAVKREFKLTLQRYSSPMAPIALLDIINDDVAEQQLDSTNSDNTNTTSASGSLRRQQADMPQDKVEDLRVMCDWLCYTCDKDLINNYADLRSDYITRSLKSLQDYQKSRSVNLSIMTSSSSAAGSSRGSIESPDLTLNKKRVGVTGSREPPATYRRTPKSIQLAFRRKLNNVIPGDVLASHKLSSTSIDEISISDREIVSYLTCMTAFHKLAIIELNLLSNIIPLDLRTKIYNRLIQEPLKLIANEANHLTIRVNKSISRNDFKSALNLFPILRHQTLRRHNFDLLFDGCQSESLAKFQSLTVTFQATISKSLEEFANFVQTNNDIKVPGDGTVHELTNNVMIFVEQLHEYLDIMSSVIPVKGDQAMSQAMMQAVESSPDKNRLEYNTIEMNRLFFAQYIARLLSSLGEAIQRKAESYTNIHLVFLFKLNNFHYILKRLRESGLLEVVHTYNQNVREIYEHLIQESKAEYIKSLSPIVNYLRDLQETRAKSVKDRFTGFNKEFQELYRLNRTYAVPDSELKTQLREACKHEFLPYYQQFLSCYVHQDFSKNKEKYIKYTPELLSSMIDQFFESD